MGKYYEESKEIQQKVREYQARDIQGYSRMVEESFDFVDPAFMNCYHNFKDSDTYDTDFSKNNLLKTRIFVLVGEKVNEKMKYGLIWNIAEQIKDGYLGMNFDGIDNDFINMIKDTIKKPIIPTVFNSITLSDSNQLIFTIKKKPIEISAFTIMDYADYVYRNDKGAFAFTKADDKRKLDSLISYSNSLQNNKEK